MTRIKSQNLRSLDPVSQNAPYEVVRWIESVMPFFMECAEELGLNKSQVNETFQISTPIVKGRYSKEGRVFDTFFDEPIEGNIIEVKAKVTIKHNEQTRSGFLRPYFVVVVAKGTLSQGKIKTMFGVSRFPRTEFNEQAKIDRIKGDRPAILRHLRDLKVMAELQP
jgi:hypothetical protein